MTQDTAHMPLDERAVAEACQAAAIEMARQVGVTLTPAGYRQGAADRPVEQSQMVAYMKAAIRAYLQTAAADVSGLVEEIHEAEWWQRGDENGQVTVSIAPERVAEAYQTLSASNAALEAENERLRGDMQRIIDAPLIDHSNPHNNPASIARAALSAPKGGQDHG